MTDVTAVFRDRGQAGMALAEALRRGWAVDEPNALLEDSAGVWVTLRATGQPEEARRLLLEYGAYRATLSSPGSA